MISYLEFFILKDATTTSPSDGGKSERAVEISLKIGKDKSCIHCPSVRPDGVSRTVDVVDVLMMIMVVDMVTKTSKWREIDEG